MNKILFGFFLLFISFSVLAIDEIRSIREPVLVPNFSNRFSVMGGVNPSMPKASDIINFNFSYAKKLEEYWLDSNIHFSNGLFPKLTSNNPSATTLTNEELEEEKSTHITFGAGLGLESSYTQTLLPFENIFEYSTANLTYNIFKESLAGKSFTGPGIMAKFSLYKKFNDFISLGGQFLYNLAVVKRGKDDDLESSSARSLTISYITIGFDLSFYL